MPQKLSINKDQADFVRNIPLFSGLSEKEKDALLEGGSLYSYPRKEHLFRQGDAIKYFYVMCDGIVQEFRETPDGHEVTANIYATGDVFCKTEIFLKDGCHHTNAVAVDNACVLQLPIEQFKETFQKYSSVSSRLLFSLSQFAFMKQVEVEQQVTMTSTEIVASFLRQLCVSYGLNPRGFTLPYKKSLIASRLGMEMETFSRTLPKLKEHGITVEGSHVRFDDLQGADWNVYGHYSDLLPYFNPATGIAVNRHTFIK